MNTIRNFYCFATTINIDLGLNGVFYRTDIEFIGLPVVKNTKAVAYIKHGLSRKK